MNIYLVRHGDKPSISGDPGISEVGVLQSKITAEYFKDKDISRIISSPFKRAFETAQEISKMLDLDIVVDERLKERLNFGDDPNLSLNQFLEEWKRTTLDRTFQPRVGDSSEATGNRVLEVLKECEEKYPNKNTVIITHGGVIYDVLRNIFSDTFLKSIKYDFLQVGIKNCSITNLVSKNGTYELKEFDSTLHLL